MKLKSMARRLDRESSELWSKGAVYQDGQTNVLWRSFQYGYAYGLFVAIENLPA